MQRPSLFVLVGLAVTGCAAATGSATSRDDNLDEAPATAVQPTPIPVKVTSCSLTAGTGDAFFRVDTLTCTQASAADLPVELVIAINTTDAKGRHGGGFLAPTAPVTVPFSFDGAYPLTVKVQASFRAGSFGGFSEDGSFVQTVTFAQPTTDAVALDLPMSFWPIAIHSTATGTRGSFSTSALDVPLAPWTTESGASSTRTIPPGGILDPAKDFTTTFLVPLGTTSIAGTVQMQAASFTEAPPPPMPVTIDGPGSFVADPTGKITRAAN